MTNHEMAIATARNLESNPVYMALATRYDEDPNSLSDKEFRMMMDLAERRCRHLKSGPCSMNWVFSRMINPIKVPNYSVP